MLFLFLLQAFLFLLLLLRLLFLFHALAAFFFLALAFALFTLELFFVPLLFFLQAFFFTLQRNVGLARLGGRLRWGGRRGRRLRCGGRGRSGCGRRRRGRRHGARGCLLWHGGPQLGLDGGLVGGALPVHAPGQRADEHGVREHRQRNGAQAAGGLGRGELVAVVGGVHARGQLPLLTAKATRGTPAACNADMACITES